MEHTIKVEREQYQRFREYAQSRGQSVEDTIREAVGDFMALTEAERREILDRR
jgi:hypothetical protein